MKFTHVFPLLCLGWSHIGNIKLRLIQWSHRPDDFSLYFRDQNCWPQSYTSKAFGRIRNLAFQKSGLKNYMPESMSATS